MAEGDTSRLAVDDPVLTPRGTPTTSPSIISRPLDQDDFAYETEQPVRSYIVPPTANFTSSRSETSPLRHVFSPTYGIHSRTNEMDKGWRKSPTSGGIKWPVVEQGSVKLNQIESTAPKASISQSAATVERSFSELTLTCSPQQQKGQLQHKLTQANDVIYSVLETKKLPGNVDLYCQQDADGDTFLHYCLIVHSTKVNTIVTMIDRAPHPDCLNVRNSHGLTPVHITIYNDQPEIMARLLNAGASLDPVDTLYGDTPALMACRWGRGACLSEIAKVVKQRVSKLCCSNGWRNVEERFADELRRVLQARDKEGLSCLQLASKLPDLSIFYNLIFEFNVDINQSELRRGMTLLHYAAYCNNVQLSRILIDLPGLDVNRLTYDGKTALQLALDRNHTDVASILRPKTTPSLVEEIDDDDESSSDSEMETDSES